MPDPRLRDLLPEFRNLFDSWMLSKRVPSLRSLGRRSALDLLKSLDQSHIIKIQEYFNDSVSVEKLEFGLVFEVELPSMDFPDLFQGFAVSRNRDNAKVTLWR